MAHAVRPCQPPGPLRRRAWLSGVGAALAGCALGPARPQAPALWAAAPGHWVLPGGGGEAGPDNLGRVANCGFIVGPEGVLAVDSGASLAHGQALLAAIHQHTGQLPRALLLTHVNQAFVFGASAFQAQGVPVWMHPAAASLMAARCDTCLKALRRAVGESALAGSQVARAERLIDPAHEDPDTLGRLIGRPLRLLAFGPGGHSSGPGALALHDPQHDVLWAGGLMDARRIPDVQDADPAGWRQALDALGALGLRRIVPGHGPLSDASLIAQTRRYLDQLDARTQVLLAQGTPLSEVADATVLPEFADWDQLDTLHRRNAAISFLRHERALLMSPS